MGYMADKNWDIKVIGKYLLNYKLNKKNEIKKLFYFKKYNSLKN